MLQENLPAYHIVSLTGQDGVDNWSEQKHWDAMLLGVRVVVGTPAVLKDALSHGFVRIHRLSLLVFDEAHHCIKNHPMNAIMRNYYHSAKARGDPVPAMLGLTASPVINPKEGGLDQLEANMDATVATPKQSIEELMRFVYPVQLNLVTYPASSLPEYPGASSLCQALAHAVASYDLSKDPYVKQLCLYDDDRSRRDLERVLKKQITRCREQICALNRRAEILYQQLGVDSAEYYVHNCVERFAKGAVHDMVLPDTTMLEQQHLLGLLQSLPRWDDAQAPAISEKAERLISLLHHQPADFVGDGKTIVFARERATVVGLTHILRNSSEMAAKYRVGGFVGTSSFESRVSIADLAESRQQAQDLRDFKNGTRNLMVATSVLEEGIDVRECNLVINFDAPDTLIGYVQRRGRARMADSKYYVLAAEGDTKISPMKWQAQENRMQREYMDAQRERAEAEWLDEEAVNSRVYRIESTGAMVTLNDAKAHLNHFCSVSTLQASNYVDLRPDYFAEKTADGEGWTASVTLPSFVHPDVRTARSRGIWHSEASAIKDAALEAYVALHRAGLLNDNLLPLVKEAIPDDGSQHVDQPSILTVAERLSSWAVLAADLADGNAQWHCTTVSFAGHSDLESVRIVLPAQLTQDEHFTLYWNEQVSYSVTIGATHAVSLSAERLETLRKDTDIALRTVHANRMPAERRTDMMLMIDLPCPLRAGRLPATEFFSEATSRATGLGLVHIRFYSGVSYILRRLETPLPEDEPGNAKLLVVRFPKRTDFLHSVPAGQSTRVAYTTEELYDVGECSINQVPLALCIFAAFQPSVMHRIDLRLLAQDLQATVLKDVGIRNTALVLEAISAPSAGETVDFNRLEYLGDAVLKFCASLQVSAQHLTWPEGYLSREKTRIVRNSTLCRAALDVGLDKFVVTNPFSGNKWRPLYASKVLEAEGKTRAMSSKTLADVVEAHIGAAFVDGGLSGAYRCIRTILCNETWSHTHEMFDRLTPDLSPSEDHSLGVLEQMVGHHFVQPTLLLEAITDASLPLERSGMSYERMEFLGDAVLDLIIAPKLHAHPRKLRHFEMHNMHEALINGLYLGYRCMSYGMLQEQNSWDGRGVQQTARTLHMHDFLRAGGSVLRAKQTSLDAFDLYRERVEQALEAGIEYPWPDLLAMSPNKVFSDLVESILGALYIDTRGDLGVCEAFLGKLGVMKQMREMLDGDMEVMSPKERLGIAAGNDNVAYEVKTETVDGRRVVRCSASVGGQVIATASSCGSRAEAEARAACEAIKILQQRGMPTHKRRRLDRDADVASCAANSEQPCAVDTDVDMMIA